MFEPEFKTQLEKREWRLRWLGEWTMFTRCAVGTVRWWKFETKNYNFTLEISEGRFSFEIEKW